MKTNKTLDELRNLADWQLREMGIDPAEVTRQCLAADEPTHACAVCGEDIGFDAPSGVCSEVCLRQGQLFGRLPQQAFECAYCGASLSRVREQCTCRLFPSPPMVAGSAPNKEDKRNGDFCRVFVGDRQISVTHFFSIGFDETTIDAEWFAFGYWRYDGGFRTGVIAWQYGGFGKENLAERRF